MSADTSRAARMLAEFHDALGDEPGRGNAPLRITLHREEHEELIEALTVCDDCAAHPEWGGPRPCDGCMEQLARELADVVYIAYGTAHAYAVDLDEALREIHRAAMSKLFPPDGTERVVRADGKILKPAGFVPPNMAAAIGGVR